MHVEGSEHPWLRRVTNIPVFFEMADPLVQQDEFLVVEDNLQKIVSQASSITQKKN